MALCLSRATCEKCGLKPLLGKTVTLESVANLLRMAEQIIDSFNSKIADYQSLGTPWDVVRFILAITSPAESRDSSCTQAIAYTKQVRRVPKQKNNANSTKSNGANVGYEAQLWQMADACRGELVLPSPSGRDATAWASRIAAMNPSWRLFPHPQPLYDGFHGFSFKIAGALWS